MSSSLKVSVAFVVPKSLAPACQCILLSQLRRATAQIEPLLDYRERALRGRVSLMSERTARPPTTPRPPPNMTARAMALPLETAELSPGFFVSKACSGQTHACYGKKVLGQPACKYLPTYAAVVLRRRFSSLPQACEPIHHEAVTSVCVSVSV